MSPNKYRTRCGTSLIKLLMHALGMRGHAATRAAARVCENVAAAPDADTCNVINIVVYK